MNIPYTHAAGLALLLAAGVVAVAAGSSRALAGDVPAAEVSAAGGAAVVEPAMDLDTSSANTGDPLGTGTGKDVTMPKAASGAMAAAESTGDDDAGTGADTEKGMETDAAGALDLDAVGGAINALALETLDALRAAEPADANVLLAPANLYGLLALLAQGAEGETRAGLAAVLGPGKSVAEAGERLRALEDAAFPPGVGAEAPAVPVLHTVYGLWTAPGVTLRPAFLDRIGEGFGAEVASADLGDPAVVEEINAWIAGRTGDRVTDLLAPGGRRGALVAMAATAFQGAWAMPFDPDQTVDGPFLPGAAEGATVAPAPLTLPMMARAFTRVPYREGNDGGQAVILPYAGGTVDMTLVLPPKNTSLDLEAAADWLDRSTYEARDGHLTLPRFTIDTAVDLARIEGPAWGPLLTGSPDFGGIAPDLGAVGELRHGVSVTLDEAGTEAGAATVAVIGRSLPQTPFEMTVNRPFLFFIRDVSSEAILFAGHVTTPARP